MKRRKQPWKLSQRMILSFMVTIILTLAVAGGFCYHQTLEVISERQISTMSHLLVSKAEALGTTMDNAVSMSEQVLYHEGIYRSIFHDYLHEDMPFSDQVAEFGQIQRYLSMLSSQFGFKQIRIFTDNDSLVYRTEGAIFYDLNALTHWIPVDASVRVRTKQVQIVDTYWTSLVKNDYRISVVRLLLEGKKLSGAVAVDIDSTALLRNWTETDMPVMLVNRDGLVLAASDVAIIRSTLTTEEAERIYTHAFMREGEMCRLSTPVENTDWRLVMTMSNDTLMGDAQDILALTGFIIIASCTVASLLVVMISRMLTRRLNDVTKTIQASERTDALHDMLARSIEEKPNDCQEISVLIQTYNRQLEHIQRLNRENEHMVLRESRYRMETLRLQINSHFLYNVLASIKGYVELRKTKTASALVMNLAGFFKRSLDRNSEFVSLEQEFETIRLYLQIQQTVYEDTFTCSIAALPESYQSIMIPKFLLQPVVENALLHGAMESEETGRICVSAWEADGDVIIDITDNGPGFKQEMIERSEAVQRSDRGYGIGLWNVAARLNLYFGQKGRLILSNGEEGGSRVSVRIPLEGLTEEAMRAYDQHHSGR